MIVNEVNTQKIMKKICLILDCIAKEYSMLFQNSCMTYWQWTSMTLKENQTKSSIEDDSIWCTNDENRQNYVKAVQFGQKMYTNRLTACPSKHLCIALLKTDN